MTPDQMPPLPDELQELIFRTLKYYANRCTYEAPRIGGVTAGCPRGEEPTPDDLVRAAIHALDRWPAARNALGWKGDANSVDLDLHTADQLHAYAIAYAAEAVTAERERLAQYFEKLYFGPFSNPANAIRAKEPTC